VKLAVAANYLLADRENGTNNSFENLVASDELAYPPLQSTCVHFPDLPPERLEDAAQMVI
jgi:hypothetical protein